MPKNKKYDASPSSFQRLEDLPDSTVTEIPDEILQQTDQPVLRYLLQRTHQGSQKMDWLLSAVARTNEHLQYTNGKLMFLLSENEEMRDRLDKFDRQIQDMRDALSDSDEFYEKFLEARQEHHKQISHKVWARIFTLKHILVSALIIISALAAVATAGWFDIIDYLFGQ